MGAMNDKYYMSIALSEAHFAAEQGEVPIGAVVVYAPIDAGTRRLKAEPRVIARAGNRREGSKDPSGHAEFIALMRAAHYLDAWRLQGCTVYVTLEPCLMCAGLMNQARVDRCVFAAFDPKAGALGSLYSVHSDRRLNHTFSVSSGILEEESISLLRTFFAQRRKIKRCET